MSAAGTAGAVSGQTERENADIVAAAEGVSAAGADGAVTGLADGEVKDAGRDTARTRRQARDLANQR